MTREQRIKFRQRVLVCDTCHSIIGVVDGMNDGRQTRWEVIFRADPSDDFETCHKVPDEEYQLKTAALEGVSRPGTHWERQPAD